MALSRRKLIAQTKERKQYLAYYKKAKAQGRRPLTYAQWVRRNKSTIRTKATVRGLKAAGLTDKEIARLRGK